MEENKNIKFKPTGIPEPNIPLDTANSLVKQVAEDPRYASTRNAGELQKFTTLAEDRERLYKIFDEMSTDVVISSALELYADDATEYSADGSIIWVESQNDEIAKSGNQILKSINLDETAWQHIHALVKYGDVYLETFRSSDLGKDLLLKNSDPKLLKEQIDDKKAVINEKLIINIYDKSDVLEEHIEMYPNPAEIFDLTQRGKTVGYLKTPEQTKPADSIFYTYKVTDNNISLYDPTKFIHITLPDTLTRKPEIVELEHQKDKGSSITHKYQVNRGKSVLADIYKIYRELRLLEDSLLLNRVTRSAIVRILGVEVGDMSKADVGAVLTQIKSLFEQKLGLTEDGGMMNYSNASPIENNIYVPIRNGMGGITTDTVGGDVNVGELTDLDYFNNKLFAGLKIPKPFLGFMDDNAGFSGGESLTKISNRYAKTIKRIQNAYIQSIRTLLNVFFLDRGQYNYINNFQVKMESPSTIEDNEKIEAIENKVSLIDNMSRLFADIENTADRLELINKLMIEHLGNSEVTDRLTEMIEDLRETGQDLQSTEEIDNDFSDLEDIFDDRESRSGTSSDIERSLEVGIGDNIDTSIDDRDLPSPDDLGIDMIDNETIESEL